MCGMLNDLITIVISFTTTFRQWHDGAKGGFRLSLTTLIIEDGALYIIV